MRTNVEPSHVLEQMARENLEHAKAHLISYQASWWTDETYKSHIEKQVEKILKLIEELQ